MQCSSTNRVPALSVVSMKPKRWQAHVPRQDQGFESALRGETEVGGGNTRAIMFRDVPQSMLLTESLGRVVWEGAHLNLAQGSDQADLRTRLQSQKRIQHRSFIHVAYDVIR